MSTELKTLNGYGFDATKLGGLDAQYYAQGRAAHNLLDNSDFRNPVNQRGATSVVDNWKYIADRWVCTNASSDAPVIVNANDITLNNTSGTQTQSIRQYLNIKDGTYTCAAKTDSTIWIICFKYSNGVITKISSSFDGKGQIYVATSGNNIYMSIQAFSGYSIKVVWAALYEGAYTSDTLPAYVPKGYAAELAECMRYYYRSNDSNSGQDGMIIRRAINMTNSTKAYSLESVDLPVPMRITPTITVFDVHGNKNYVQEWHSNNQVGNTSIRYANNRSFCVVSESGEFIGGKSYYFNYEASADL